MEEILHHQKDVWNQQTDEPQINWCRISQPSTVAITKTTTIFSLDFPAPFRSCRTGFTGGCTSNLSVSQGKGTLPEEFQQDVATSNKIELGLDQ